MTVSLYSKLHNPQDTDPIQRFVERFDGDILDDRWLITILRGTGNVTMVDDIDEGLNLLAQGPNPSDLKTKISFGGIRSFSNTGAVMLGIWRAVETTDNASNMALVNISADAVKSNFIESQNAPTWRLVANDGVASSGTNGSVRDPLQFQRNKIEIAPTVATLIGNGILEASVTTRLPTLKLEPTFQVNSKVSGLARNMRVRYASVYNT